jgi:hypothetical protein
MLSRKPLMSVDYDPANQNTGASTRLVEKGGKPTIAELKAAISGSGVSAKYPASFMFKATKDDLIFICRTEGIAVAGLPGA